MLTNYLSYISISIFLKYKSHITKQYRYRQKKENYESAGNINIPLPLQNTQQQYFDIKQKRVKEIITCGILISEYSIKLAKKYPVTRKLMVITSGRQFPERRCCAWQAGLQTRLQWCGTGNGRLQTHSLGITDLKGPLNIHCPPVLGLTVKAPFNLSTKPYFLPLKGRRMLFTKHPRPTAETSLID